MSQTFFFTETDLLNVQNANHAFGAIGLVGNDEKFRVTSLHTSSGSPSAFAMLDGIVCVQKVTGNPSIVNLILKPSAQSQISFTPAKYIIYKGLSVSSIFDGIGNIANIVGNDLCASLYASQTAFNSSYDIANNNPPGTTTTPPSENALGINLDSSVQGFTDSDSIDALFFQLNSNFQFPLVKGGWKLGEFDPTLFGIEIITDHLFYDPRLALARSIEGLISVPQLSVTPTSSEFFKHWHDKEAILSFIDPCAYIGLHYVSGIQSKTTSGSFNRKTGDEIYDEILSLFENRNITYLDIRNEHNHSFDYYKNYGTDILITYDPSSPVQPMSYYASGWPLLKVGNTSFPTGNTSSKNIIRLNFPAGDNEFPLLNLETGYFNSNKPFKTKNGKRRFVDLLNQDNDFSNEISLAVPNCTTASDTTTIASLIRLRLLRRDDLKRTSSYGTVFRTTFPLDNFSFPFLMKLPSNSDELKVRVYGEEFFCDFTADNGFSYMGRLGVAEDSTSLTYFAVPVAFYKRGTSKNINPVSISSFSSNESSGFWSYLRDRYDSDEVKYERLSLANDFADVIKFELSHTVRLGKVSKTSLTPVSAISIKKADLPNFLALANAGGLSNDYQITFAIANPVLQNESDDNDVPYVSYDLILRGFEDVNGTIQVKDVLTNQKIYSHVAL